MKTGYTFFALTMFLVSVLAVFSCKKEESKTPPAPIPQECKIIIPADSIEIQIGNTVRVEVSISGFGTDAKVVFSVDTSQMSESFYAPYVFVWQTSGWPEGSHTIKADAFDANFIETDMITIILIDTIIPPTPPVAVISITPQGGNTDTIFSFDAGNSYDLNDATEELLFRWDFDGDGFWDTEFTHEGIFMHKYTHPGNYHVVLEVMDTDEMTADTVKSLLVEHTGNIDACEGYVTVPLGGKVYHTVAIGDQCWLRESLDIGTMIMGGEAPSDNEVIEKYCYNDDTLMCDKYGGLYMWDEMMNYIPLQGSKGICPNGWHIPSDAEWKELEGFADSQYGIDDPEWDLVAFRGSDAGKHLKALTGWDSGGNGNNLYDFKALAGGYWESGTSFAGESQSGRFWSASHDNGHNAFSRMLKYDTDQVSRDKFWDEAAFSVRCLRD